MKSSLDTRNFTKKPVPSFPYKKALEKALPGWDISLVFAGEQRAQSINVQLRNKDYIPNVLSYQTGDKSGEIIICLEVAKKQAPDYEMSYTNFVGYLFIHGLMHLAGRRHGPTMEHEERALLARLVHIPTSHGTKNRNRH